MEFRSNTQGSRFTPIYTIFVLLSIAFCCISFFANPPNGHTGAPGDNLCTACHNPPSPPPAQDGNVQIAGLPAMISPNTSYTLTVTSNNPNGMAVRAGFQMVVLNQSNQNAGTLSNNSANTAIQSSGGRTYFEHNPAATYPVSNTVSWTVNWLSPSLPSGTVITAYAANNVANGNGFNTGDLIVTTSASGSMIAGAPLMATIANFTNVSCFGDNDGTATAQGVDGIPPYSYAWSSGSNSQTATNLFAGSYTVTVTDGNASTATAMVSIGQPTEVMLNVTGQTNNDCNGEEEGSATVSATGGTGDFSYSWSNGGNGPGQFNLAAGTYSVTATDENGCTDVTTVTITAPPAIDLLVTNISDISCNGDDDGSATVTADGGAGPYTYTWSNGANGPTQNFLPAGGYEVTVTDQNGCTSTTFLEITEPLELEAILISTTDVSCIGDADGTAVVSGLGGTPDYFYSWSIGGGGTAMANLDAGDYSVTVEDVNGCTAIVDFVIFEPDPILVNADMVNIDCNGNSTGSISVSSSGGAGNYTYSWSNGGSGTMQSGLAAGMYSLTVSDENGCSATDNFTLTEPEVLMANPTSTPESEAGASDGTASANPTGGTPPYSYMWSNLATTQMITGLSPGSYTLTVSDANACSSIQSVTVSSGNCVLSATVQVTLVTCNGMMDGTAAPIISNGTPPYTFAWSNGSTDSLVTALGPGSYTVTIMDGSDCETTANTMITQPMAINVTVQTTAISEVGAMDGTASAMPTGGTPPYTYIWSNAENTMTINGLAAGTYSVTVTDANGCAMTGSGTIQDINCPPVTETGSTITDVSCFGGSDGSIDLNVTGGTPPYTYSWDSGQATEDLTDLSAGIYMVTIIDAEGCIGNVSFTVNEPPALNITVDSVLTEEINDDGAIYITVTGGTPPYSFVWTDFSGEIATSEDLVGVGAGDYDVLVTDANGCLVDSANITVTISGSIFNPADDTDYQLYPNPAYQQITLVLQDQKPFSGEWTLMDLNGREVQKGTLDKSGSNESVIELTEIKSGLYFFGLKNNGQFQIRRLVIQQ